MDTSSAVVCVPSGDVLTCVDVGSRLPGLFCPGGVFLSACDIIPHTLQRTLAGSSHNLRPRRQVLLQHSDPCTQAEVCLKRAEQRTPSSGE